MRDAPDAAEYALGVVGWVGAFGLLAVLV